MIPDLVLSEELNRDVYVNYNATSLDNDLHTLLGANFNSSFDLLRLPYFRENLDQDMLIMARTGQYKIVVREADGERFIFPITDTAVMTYGEISDEIESSSLNLETWLGVNIPEVYTSPGFLQWIKTDDCILHMKRPHLPDDHQENYVGRFSYNPNTNEFLPSMISLSHNDSIRAHGNRPFNEYIRGIYVREKKTLLLKAYFNPLDENGKFDPTRGYDRELDRIMTMKTLEMLVRNGLPTDVLIIVHANNTDVGKYTPFK